MLSFQPSSNMSAASGSLSSTTTTTSSSSTSDSAAKSVDDIEFKRLSRTKAALLEALCTNSSPKETIQRILQDQTSSFKTLLDSYTRPTPSSRSQLSNLTTAEDEKSFVLKLSDVLNLDEQQTLTILRNFQRAEWENTALQGRWGMDKLEMSYNDTVFHQTIDFYFSERISSINVVSQLLRIAGDPNAEYAELASQVVDNLLGTPESESAFITAILTQIQQAMTRVVPDMIANDFHVRKQFWMRQFLKEQKALLELLVLVYYSHAVITPQRVLELSKKIVLEWEFGRKQVYLHELDGECLAVLEQITQLCVLVIIEALNMEKLLEPISFNNNNQVSTLYHDPEALVKLNEEVFATLSATTWNAPVLLAWGCYLTRIKEELSSALLQALPQYQRFAKLMERDPDLVYTTAAIKSNVFGDVLLATLRSDLYAPESTDSIAYKSVMKGLLLAFVTIIELSTFPNSYQVLKCFEALFKGHPDLAEQYWDCDNDVTERRSFLSFARHIFPFKFRPLVKLLTSLAGSKASVEEVLPYFADLPAFTTCFAPTDFVWESTGEYGHRAFYKFGDFPLVANTSESLSLTIPAQTPARRIGSADPKVVMQWQLKYSGWHYTMSLLSAFVNMGGMENVKSNNSSQTLKSGRIAQEYALDAQYGEEEDGMGQASLIRRVADVMLLWQTVLEKDDHLAQEFIKHLCYFADNLDSVFRPRDIIMLIFNVLNKATMLNDPPTELVTSCLRCITALLKSFPQEVWQFLRQTNWVSVPTAISNSTNMTLVSSLSSWISSSPTSASTMSALGLLSSSETESGWSVNAMYQMLQIEQQKGSYPVTMAYLDLVKELLRESQKSASGSSSSSTTTTASSKTKRRQHDDDDEEQGNDNDETGFGNDFAIDAKLLQTIKREVLLGLVVFIQSKIFVQFDNWKYEHVVDKFALGQAAIDIYIEILRDTSEGRKLVKLRKQQAHDADVGLGILHLYLLQVFVQDASAYQVFPLLNILGSGKEALDRFVTYHKAVEKTACESLLISTFDFTLRLIQWHRSLKLTCASLDEPAPDSPLELSLLKYPFGRNRLELVYLIASYVSYDFNYEICKLATQLLTLLATVNSSSSSSSSLSSSQFSSSMSIGPNMGFVGCFGDYVYTLSSRYVQLLRYEHLDESVQIACWEFAGTVVESQPALANIFLAGGKGPREYLFDDKMTRKEIMKSRSRMMKEKLEIHETSILAAIVEILRNIDVVQQSRRGVVPAMLGFLEKLWKNGSKHSTFVAKLKRNPNFWKGMASIVRSGLQVVDVPALTSADYQKGVSIAVSRDAQGVVSVNSTGGTEEVVVRDCETYFSAAHVLSLTGIEVLRESPKPSMTAGRTIRIDTLEADVKDIVQSIIKSSSWWDQLIEKEWNDTEFLTCLVSTAREMLVSGYDLEDFISLHNSHLMLPQFTKRFGDNFMFDVSLLATKLLDSRSSFKASSPTPAAKSKKAQDANISKFLSLVIRANHMSSLMDAQFEALTRWVRFLHLSASNLGLTAWGTMDTLYQFINRLTGWLAKSGTTGEKQRKFREEVSELLSVLVEKWISLSKETGGKKASPEKIGQLLQNLVDALQKERDIVNSNGTFVYPKLHLSLFSVLLRLLQSLDKRVSSGSNGTVSDMTFQSRLQDSLSSLLGITCEVAGLLYTSIMNRHFEGIVEHVDLITSVLAQFIRKLGPSNESSWLFILHQQNIIKLAISVWMSSLSLVAHSLESTKQLRSQHHNALIPDVDRDAILLAESVLILLRTLANTPLAAERLAVHDVMLYISNNPCTLFWQNPSEVLFYTATKERNRLQALWCGVLSLITSLLEHLGDSERFVEAVIGALGIYRTRMTWVMNDFVVTVQRYIMGTPMELPGGMTPSSGFTMAHIEEIVRWMETMHMTSRSLQGLCAQRNLDITSVRPEFMSHFTVLGAQLFQSMIQALNFPGRLAEALVPTTREEKYQAQMSALSKDTPVSTEKPEPTLLLRIFRDNMISALRALSGSLRLLLGAEAALQPNRPVFRENELRVFDKSLEISTPSATFGGLFYGISIMANLVRQVRSPSVDTTMTLIPTTHSLMTSLYILESTYLILTSQILSWWSFPLSQITHKQFIQSGQAMTQEMQEEWVQAQRELQNMVETDFSQYRNEVLKVSLGYDELVKKGWEALEVKEKLVVEVGRVIEVVEEVVRRAVELNA